MAVAKMTRTRTPLPDLASSPPDALPGPYYQDELTTLYLGDARLITPLLDPSAIALCIADPPYGVGERTARGSSGRSSRVKSAKHYVHSGNYPPVAGDDEPYDPSPLLTLPRLIIFGANHFANLLPNSPSWFIWDKMNGLTGKRRDLGICDAGDFELMWSNLGGAPKIIQHRWLGMLKQSETKLQRVHPTQKPIAIMEKLIAHYTKPGDLVYDPYMGSGPVAVAARRLGRRYIGVELVEDYVILTLERLHAMCNTRSPARAQS